MQRKYVFLKTFLNCRPYFQVLGILPSNKVGREKGAILQVCDSCNCQEAVCDSYNHWEAVCDSYNHREAVCDSSLSKKNLFFF